MPRSEWAAVSGGGWGKNTEEGRPRTSALDKVTLEISEGQIKVAIVTNEGLQTRSDRPFST